jgi:hypothetical protein
MSVHAVLTGDIVNSTLLGKAREKHLITSLQKIFSGFPFEFYRGDSFQTFIRNPKEALRIALKCRAVAIRTRPENESFEFDIRVSIGIGHVNGNIKTVGTAKGEAFVLSGHSFDEMSQKGTRLSIRTGNLLANEGLGVIANYINTIFTGMTGKQAEVIFELLNGKTQQAIAEKIQKSKSTINQFVSSGRWAEIEELLVRFENIINQIS